jgi:hypothetical protein
LTPKGNIRLADGKALVGLLETRDRFDHEIDGHVFKTKSTHDLCEVDLTFRLALAVAALTVKGQRLVPGRHAGDLQRDVDAAGTATLTPLGRWAVAQQLARTGEAT